jgi:hypothetical protein
MTKLQTNKQVIVRTIAIRKPVLSRQMHLRINNRAWLKAGHVQTNNDKEVA